MRVAADDRNLVAGEPVLRQQLAEFQLDQLEQLGVVDQVDLVEEHDQRGHVDLAGQQDVLAGLRHRAVGGRDHQDRPVHLGGAGDHVLDVVGVARAVDVGVVPLVGLVLDVADGDGHRLGRVADRAALGDVGVRLELGQTLGGLDGQDGAGQRGLAVVDVADGAHVDVRFGPCRNTSLAIRYLPALNQADRLSEYWTVELDLRSFDTADKRAADGTRTHDLVLTKDALYRLSYSSPSSSPRLRARLDARLSTSSLLSLSPDALVLDSSSVRFPQQRLATDPSG